ncbi:Pr6Pr family membrane protein [Kribbella sp. NPDC048928]|uniref:Pr6Pr family membrane protein n=1 Tax=Kribbella sp. NPDC048928 TaxID=3364111 RepID=UPI00371DE5DA
MLGWHAATFVVAAGAVLLQLILVLQGHQHLGETEPAIQAASRPGLGVRVLRFASYLTIWSNVLAAVVAATLALRPDRDGRWWRALRLDAVVILFGGGIVHWFFLRPLLDLHGADRVADKLLHVVVPLVVVVGWIVVGPRGRIGTSDLGRFLVLPVIWLVYTLVRGAIVGWYPYPFVDVDQHGYPYVTIAALAIGALLVGLALVAKRLDRHLPGVAAKRSA